MSDINGVNLDTLTEADWGDHTGLPEIDPELVHLCDADLGAYKVVDLDKTPTENLQDFLEYIEYRRLLCGAGASIPFITQGVKGGRYDLAVVQEYQANRSNRDPETTQRVRELRSLLAENDPRCVVCSDEEADDVLVQRQVQALAEGRKTVIDSDDKDLRMAPGLHLDPQTLQLVEVSGYGHIWLDESTSTKKVLGWGTAFFWAQMLMGDSADNIPGLPKLPGSLANKYQPTKEILKALDVVADPTKLSAKRDAAQKKIDARKSISIGPVLTYTVLKDCTSDAEAMAIVFEAYRSYYPDGVFDQEHWDGSIVRKTANHMILEQARLLWMRRVPRECVSTFFSEVGNTGDNPPWD